MMPVGRGHATSFWEERQLGLLVPIVDIVAVSVKHEQDHSARLWAEEMGLILCFETVCKRDVLV
jgi:hypothetical protein